MARSANKRTDVDPVHIRAILPLLFWTHASYADRPSRQAVQRCLTSICKKKNAVYLAPLVTAMRQESQKPGIATSSAFVLVEWCSLLMGNIGATPLWDEFGQAVILSNADVLEKCLQPSSRKSMAHSALVSSRRGLRKLFAAAPDREKAIRDTVETLAAKSSQPTARNSILLGVVAGVCWRNEKARAALAKLKSQFFTFYSREIIGSKTSVAKHVADGLHDFFSTFVSASELEKEVVPALEKGLLRAPEIVLDDLITPLIQSLPKALDLSDILKLHFMKPLVSNIKSTNAIIRTGAVSAFCQIASRCAKVEVMGEIADEIIAPLKSGKVASPDHRVLHAEMLLAVVRSESVAIRLSSTIPLVLGKEGNEIAMSAEALALNKCTMLLLGSSKELPQGLTGCYAKGLADKKPSVRRIWAPLAGEALYCFSGTDHAALSQNSVRFAEAVLPPLFDMFSEALANPISASQNNTTIGALVASSIAPRLLRDGESPGLAALLKKSPMSKQWVAMEPRSSFLLNPRFYSKLSAEEDLRWLHRALGAVFSELPGDNAPDVSSAWGQCFLYVICSTAVSSRTRREACESLSRLYVSHPSRVWEIIVGAIWQWLTAINDGDKESAAMLAKSENKSLHLVLACICLDPEQVAKRFSVHLDNLRLEEQMCSLLVLARPSLLPRCSWIDLCLRVHLDPGMLAQKHEDLLVREITERTSLNQRVSQQSWLFVFLLIADVEYHGRCKQSRMLRTPPPPSSHSLRRKQ